MPQMDDFYPLTTRSKQAWWVVFFSFLTILQFPKALERPEYVAGRVKSLGLRLLSAIFHHHQIETSADILLI